MEQDEVGKVIRRKKLKKRLAKCFIWLMVVTAIILVIILIAKEAY